MLEAASSSIRNRRPYLPNFPRCSDITDYSAAEMMVLVLRGMQMERGSAHSQACFLRPRPCMCFLCVPVWINVEVGVCNICPVTQLTKKTVVCMLSTCVYVCTRAAHDVTRARWIGFSVMLDRVLCDAEASSGFRFCLSCTPSALYW
jgi:hypothetical protein